MDFEFSPEADEAAATRAARLVFLLAGTAPVPLLIFAGAFMAGNGWPSLRLTFLILLAGTSARVVAMTLNLRMAQAKLATELVDGVGCTRPAVHCREPELLEEVEETAVELVVGAGVEDRHVAEHRPPAEEHQRQRVLRVEGAGRGRRQHRVGGVHDQLVGVRRAQRAHQAFAIAVQAARARRMGRAGARAAGPRPHALHRRAAGDGARARLALLAARFGPRLGGGAGVRCVAAGAVRGPAAAVRPGVSRHHARAAGVAARGGGAYRNP